MNPIKIGLGVVLAFFGLSLAFGSFYTVDEGERAVILYNGAVTGTADPGLHWKKPLVEDVVTFSVRDNVVNFEGLQAYTRDQQVATVTNISINYRVDPSEVKNIYVRYGSIDNMVGQLVTRRVGESLERVFGQYNAESAVRDRAKLSADFGALIKDVKGPLMITSVQVENFSFPDEYEKNINARMAAEVEATKAEQTARKTVTEAKAKADSQLAIAKANAEAVRLQGEAEAAAIKAKSEALEQSPNLVELTKAERWDGKLPQTFVPGSAVPFLNLH